MSPSLGEKTPDAIAPKDSLTADAFLMVTPAHLDACQCPDNVFTDLVHGVDHVKALEQHAAVVDRLRSLGKKVQVFEGRLRMILFVIISMRRIIRKS